MHNESALVLTILVLCYAVVSGLIQRWYVAPALIFVVTGVVLGPSGVNVIRVDAGTLAFTILAQLALAVMLFNQASMLDVRSVLSSGRLGLRLLAIGIPVTIAIGTQVAVVLLPTLGFWEAVCLAVIVAPTDVALIDALTEDRRIPERLRNALSVESGFYDGFALAVLFAALALASEHTHPAPARWAWFAFRTEVVSAAVGIVIGILAALVISRSTSRGWMSGTWAQLATLAVALVCFGVGERLHASGFVAAFAAGLAYAVVLPKRGVRVPMTEVSDAASQLLELLVFAVFGGFAVVQAWRHIGWQVLLFATVSLFVVRIAAVAIALLRSGLSPGHTFFVGWFGPRGIGTLVLGLLVIDSGEIHNAGLITQTAAVTVTLSLVIHSLTAPLGIRLCSNGISTQTHAATRTDESPPPGLPHGRGENGRTNRP